MGCGGVRVFPGDIIVADGDGVIVVPRGHAEIVARIARDIANDDKASRRQRFREAGLDDDFTVAPLG